MRFGWPEGKLQLRQHFWLEGGGRCNPYATRTSSLDRAPRWRSYNTDLTVDRSASGLPRV